MDPGFDYDVVIIGGGIAGLYAAWRLSRAPGSLRIAVLESSSRFGGRVGTSIFAGVPVASGAGIGRVGKDSLLERLVVQDMKLESRRVPVSFSYSPEVRSMIGPHDARRFMGACLAKLKNALRTDKANTTQKRTFRSFARACLSPRTYAAFAVASGYTDYEAADARDALANYGFDDVYESHAQIFTVPWSMLVQALKKEAADAAVALHPRAHATAVATSPNGLIVHVSSTTSTSTEAGTSTMMTCRRVIVACNPGALRRMRIDRALARPSLISTLVRQVQSQPFVRVYAVFHPSCWPAVSARVPSFTIVRSPLQKIIPIRPDRGIYMVAYSDNASARAVVQGIEARGKAYLQDAIERALGLDRGVVRVSKFRSFWFEVGTHFVRPGVVAAAGGVPAYLARAADEGAYDARRLAFVGEAFSSKQGWCEGALETVVRAT